MYLQLSTTFRLASEVQLWLSQGKLTPVFLGVDHGAVLPLSGIRNFYANMVNLAGQNLLWAPGLLRWYMSQQKSCYRYFPMPATAIPSPAPRICCCCCQR